jgi:hypothetical protein
MAHEDHDDERRLGRLYFVSCRLRFHYMLRSHWRVAKNLNLLWETKGC